MQFAAGRLRVSVSFSCSAVLEPNEKDLFDKARAQAERSLSETYPPRTVRKFDTVKVIPQGWWRHNGLLESRTALLLNERRLCSPRSMGALGAGAAREYAFLDGAGTSGACS